MAATILDQLADYAKYRVKKDKEKKSLEEIKEESARKLALMPEELEEVIASKGRFKGAFYKALAKKELSFICEVKKASPSKGLIDAEFNYLKIAREYEEAGADAISCLTEPKWFLGSDDYFRQIREITHLPMIRKDFTIDEYQIYQAFLMGADAILIIVAITPLEEIVKYLDICNALGIDALVECHDEEEIKISIEAKATIIGVNNRNLKDFTVDIRRSESLRGLIPKDCIYVSESGIRNLEDVLSAKEIRADALLVGEALMRAKDKKGFLEAMRSC